MQTNSPKVNNVLHTNTAPHIMFPFRNSSGKYARTFVCLNSKLFKFISWWYWYACNFGSFGIKCRNYSNLSFWFSSYNNILEGGGGGVCAVSTLARLHGRVKSAAISHRRRRTAFLFMRHPRISLWPSWGDSVVAHPRGSARVLCVSMWGSFTLGGIYAESRHQMWIKPMLWLAVQVPNIQKYHEKL